MPLDCCRDPLNFHSDFLSRHKFHRRKSLNFLLPSADCILVRACVRSCPGALPAALVDKVKVDVGNMKVGDTIRVKDLEIAKDKEIDLSTDPEAVVATVTAVHNVVPETETEETAEE